MVTNLENICYLKKGVKTKRVSSYDRSGGNSDAVPIESGEVKEIANIEKAGIIKHIWFTIKCEDSMVRRNAVIRMYWDREENPSFEAPLGDFFGQGWGEEYNFESLPLAAAPAGGRALNSYFAMPFSDGARITIDNQSDRDILRFFYYIDYEEHESIPEDMARFHAWWNRELTEAHHENGEAEWGMFGGADNNPTTKNNYLFADIKGKGHFVGINYYVDNPSPMWYGEGDDMWLVDGEEWPGSLHGTGTEDFFNSSWCPKKVYTHPYFGYARVNNNIGWLGRTHCYRFFMEDPIYFNKSLNASIEHGHSNTLTLDICTVAYWYQTEPHKKFPELPPKSERQNMPKISVCDIHEWRHEWRQTHDNDKKLWGNEDK